MEKTKHVIFEYEFIGRSKAVFHFAAPLILLTEKLNKQLEDLCEGLSLSSEGALSFDLERLNIGRIEILLNPTLCDEVPEKSYLARAILQLIEFFDQHKVSPDNNDE
ncbi:MAG: hypothetical protein Q4B65_02230 [Candidatus Saccharibacteria bacterium]|nr:hypothetical protein [Candidatus Saccharibacteria bacterium]